MVICVNIYKICMFACLVWFYGILTLIGYLMPNLFHTYILQIGFLKHILLITFLNEPELIFLHTVKWFHLSLSSTNNSIYY